MSDDSPPPTYLSSNKPEAERCVEMAAAAWKAGDLTKAQRMLQKSLKLYPTVQAQTLIQQLSADVERTAAREAQRQEHTRQAAAEAQRERERQQQQQQQQQQHRPPPHQQAYQRPAAAAAHSTPSKASPSPSPAAGSASPSGGAGYTVEQSESARAIVARSKDYYSLFSVERTATDVQIKSSYRKLALRFHPDKNKAPEAEEAFKVVNAAFQCLSDPQKRAHYDAHGVDEPNGGRGGGGGGGRQQQYERSDDLSPEDVFNMFFNGGMGMGGNTRRTYTYRRQAAPRQQHAHHAQDDSPAALFSQFAHFLPLLLLLLFGLLSAPGGDEQLFGLDKSAAFPLARVTKQAQVPYYVNSQFAYRFQRDRRALEQVEGMVEQQAFKIAEELCQKQKKQFAEEERRVKHELKGRALAERLQAMQGRTMDQCEKLHQYQMHAHGAKAG